MDDHDTLDGDAAGDDDALDLMAALVSGDISEDDAGPGGDGPGQGAPGTAPARDRFGADLDAFALDAPLTTGLTLRPYQEEAIAAWSGNAGRGLIVLPTGAGKTVVAMAAIAAANVRTLVVVPTIELLRQWQAEMSRQFSLPLAAVGIVGGGKRTLRDLTVITYDSAAMRGRRLDGFGLLVVDEVHHLPATGYRTIATKVAAPLRLGLSATPERSDHGHVALDQLIGPIVFRRSVAELSRDRYIADYDERRVFISLSDDERLRYEQGMGIYKRYLASRRGAIGRPDGAFMEMIQRAGTDPAARAALQAHHQARMIALNADGKLDAVADLLAKHPDDRVIVFSEYNAMVDRISGRLLLPAITHRTLPAERRQILERFRDGTYTKLVTGRVLNEGVDVPDANVAIVVSGSSATREYIQRLGRVLRPKATKAVLYELVSRKTTEGRSARKRRPAEAIDPGRTPTARASAARAGALADPPLA
ncbi:MAG: DEAD/DEAH box helicase [Chloroflexota bacterium]|nr:DEAD/DEAH box helicase [Chloroflexota bacterium]